MSENIILILVSALVLVVLVLVGVILFLFKELMKEKDMTQNPEHSTEPSRIKGQEGATPFLDQMRKSHSEQASHLQDEISYCVNHPNDNAKGLCAICQEGFCDECLKEHDGLTFCGPHFRLYLGDEWVELETIKTTPETPESAYPIYDFKKELWEKEGLPAIVSTHYKINIESDTIESFVKLLVRSSEESSLKERFERYKH